MIRLDTIIKCINDAEREEMFSWYRYLSHGHRTTLIF